MLSHVPRLFWGFFSGHHWTWKKNSREDTLMYRLSEKIPDIYIKSVQSIMHYCAQTTNFKCVHLVATS